MNARCPEDLKMLNIRIVQILLNVENSSPSAAFTREKEILLYIALFPSNLFSLAKQFWQHTGLGISSRMAERCLMLIEHTNTDSPDTGSVTLPRMSSPRNKRYAANRLSRSRNPSTEETATIGLSQDSEDQSAYVEERYGRNMPISAADDAKRALRRRIAGVLAQDDDASLPDEEQASHPSLRGENVTENDVYLFPSGMSSIWTAHQLCLAALQPGKSVCFGWVFV